MLSTNGITLEYDDIGAVVTQQRSLGYYRGESAFYGFPTTLMDMKYLLNSDCRKNGPRK